MSHNQGMNEPNLEVEIHHFYLGIDSIKWIWIKIWKQNCKMIKELLIYIIDCNNQLILTIKMNRYIYFQLFYFFLRTAMDHY
jgi:hypothetical protein